MSVVVGKLYITVINMVIVIESAEPSRGGLYTSISFFIGNFPIRAYGLIMSLSIILATGTAYFLAKQDGRWHQHVPDIGIYGGLVSRHCRCKVMGCFFL